MQFGCGVVCLLILFGVGSCVYNVRQAAKNDYVYLTELDSQKIIIHTVNGDFGFETKNVKSIEFKK